MEMAGSAPPRVTREGMTVAHTHGMAAHAASETQRGGSFSKQKKCRQTEELNRECVATFLQKACLSALHWIE